MGDRPAATSFRVVTFPARWVARWQLWQLPRRVLTLVIAVHLATIGSTVGTALLFPSEQHDHHLMITAVLVGLGVVHLELSRNIERLRAKEAGNGPYYDLKTVWNVAALLLLPPLLATVVVVSTHLYGFLRVHRRNDNKAHRWAYSGATVVLATQAAAVLLAVGTDAYPGIPGPTPLQEWFVVFVAVAIRWLVNYLLIILVSVLMRPQVTFKDAFAQLGEHVNEAAATALAIMVAVLLEHGYPVLLVCVYLVVGVLQQTSYYHHWKRERPYDPVTGVYSRTSFIEQAQAILDRARFRGDAVGCLLLDLDFFKKINDTHGHNVGDKALVALADVIKQEVREGKDIPARWGGEEFVVLVPEVTREKLHEIAERIRTRVGITSVVYTRTDAEDIEAQNVTMTVSIGAALFPSPENRTTDETLLDLVERADKLMYAAKAAGRNQVCSTLPARNNHHIVATPQTSDYATEG
jgi:diguanylate cyclase (GGDEF)-like protein